MEDQLISFETAKLAKRKGFNIPVLNSYGLEDIVATPTDDNTLFDINTKGMYGYSAPSQSLLQRWLRERCNLEIFVEKNHWWRIRNIRSLYLVSLWSFEYRTNAVFYYFQ